MKNFVFQAEDEKDLMIPLEDRSKTRFWFACFLGAVTSCLVLVWYVRRNIVKPEILSPVACEKHYLNIEIPESMAERIQKDGGIWQSLKFADSEHFEEEK